VERDQLVGTRGEEIVYRQELEKVRRFGHARPEDYVSWTSRSNPGADHDIRSITEDSQPLWIEVKSTAGTDGRFDWPKKEFEKALREGNHYELWRVYEADTAHPTIKRFRDPVSLLRRAALRLDLGTLRAMVEPMQAPSSAPTVGTSIPSEP